MPVIRIQNTRRRTGEDGGMTEVSGQIQVAGAVAAYPAGSFGLRGIADIVFSPANPLVKRTVVGSISDPITIIGNTVQLNVVHTGTTGTRLASIATIGSMAASATASANFTAHGY